MPTHSLFSHFRENYTEVVDYKLQHVDVVVESLLAIEIILIILKTRFLVATYKIFASTIIIYNYQKKGRISYDSYLFPFQFIYTHRQKLSNSKFVLNIKKCFVSKYWKFKFYYLLLTSLE